ncbi:Parvovirus coat protein VP1-like protein [Caldifermentibacillus hisashii]|uniref:Parvovirus coat protein VP1-like protein n=1 Tax=Caldifermentibacillus hisashii TaxID=996558 RepID=UPI0009078220|nr:MULTISPECIES: Parvovirus coat protein VP1-like protein [Bacillaceae]MCB7069828.1 Parvovirus coat protein VP1-like protein [Caldibacillus sp. 210928-DFI.2.22]MCB7073270.1 Parvovirus coat protein VP1-like protein [Caldibacillus sp. 210928-DFI.2.18]NWN97292.1 Parvovirus coat protein VP1-like protein [Bacillus sp. (in: firmicutes)]AWI12469.1 Parvovirus coat protein VP1-like protein [Caldibacillus thermoamylovorans]MCM3055700.1 Parvovirus coat protein VP1-like protein [Caldibacillus thermoamylov
MYKSKRRGFCFPGYNWCGPGCSGPGRPTNPVDACCKAHDECYRRYGHSRYCDEMFKRCLQPYRNRHTRMGRDASLFSRFFTVKNFFF